MSEPKHTPGPWTSSLMDYHSEDPTVITISGSNNNNVCEILDGSVEDADLALMLAAPDMYEALEAHCETCYSEGMYMSNMPWCVDCTTGKALRKARGEKE